VSDPSEAGVLINVVGGMPERPVSHQQKERGREKEQTRERKSVSSTSTHFSRPSNKG